jgi:hypothetical protein
LVYFGILGGDCSLLVLFCFAKGLAEDAFLLAELISWTVGDFCFFIGVWMTFLEGVCYC